MTSHTRRMTDKEKDKDEVIDSNTPSDSDDKDYQPGEGEEEDEDQDMSTDDDSNKQQLVPTNMPYLVIPMPHLAIGAALSCGDEYEQEQEQEQEQYEENDQEQLSAGSDPDFDPNHPEEETKETLKRVGRTRKRSRSRGRKRERSPSPESPPAHQDMYTDEDFKYFKKLKREKKVEITKLETEIEKLNKVDVPLRFRILESDMDISLKSIAIAKANQLACMRSQDDEYFKVDNWVRNLCKLPIGKYKPLPINAESSRDEIAGFLDSVKKHLDDTVYGHDETKDSIIRLLAKWIVNKDSKGLVIGLEGVPGSGKTSIAMEICSALGLPFGFQSLGGISQAETLKGFQYTYQGSTWGAIADILMKAGCMNPILFFDELDKVSTTRAGEEIINTLIHLTDHSQNHKYTDRYFADIDLDLSKCLMIFSYNDGMLINPILKDRMVRIKVSGYNLKDKTKIAREFMLPKILKEYAFNDGDIVIPGDVISHIINIIEEEQGVRNLKRALEEIVSRVNLHRLLKKPIELTKTKTIEVSTPFEITRDVAELFLTSKADRDLQVSLGMMYL